MNRGESQFERRRAAFFADLANIESLKTLKGWQQGQLMEQAREVGFRFRPSWKQIEKAHSLTHDKINALLDQTRPVDLTPILRSEATTRAVFNLKSGSLVFSRTGEGILDDRMIEELAQIIRSSDSLFGFPFRRCSVCGNVFAKWKNQKFCSPACTTRGNEAARKDERREYMRQYMREARQPNKRKEKHGTPK